MAGSAPSEAAGEEESTDKTQPKLGGIYTCAKALRVRISEDKESARHALDDIPSNTPFVINQFGDNPTRGLVQWDSNGVRQQGWVSVFFPGKQNLTLKVETDPAIIESFRETTSMPTQKVAETSRTNEIPDPRDSTFFQSQGVNMPNLQITKQPIGLNNEFSKAPPLAPPPALPTNGSGTQDQVSINFKAPGVPQSVGDVTPQKRAVTPSLNGAPEQKKDGDVAAADQQWPKFPPGSANFAVKSTSFAVKSSTPVLPPASVMKPKIALQQQQQQQSREDPRTAPGGPHGRPRSRSKSSPPPEKRLKNNRHATHHAAPKRQEPLTFRDYDAGRYRGGADDMFSEDSEPEEEIEGEDGNSDDGDGDGQESESDPAVAMRPQKRLCISNEPHQTAPRSGAFAGSAKQGGPPAGFDSEGFREFIRTVVRRTIHQEHVFKHTKNPGWDGFWRPPKPGSEAAKYIRNPSKKCTTCDMVNAVTNMIFHQEQCRKFEQADNSDAKERVIEKYVQRYMRNH